MEIEVRVHKLDGTLLVTNWTPKSFNHLYWYKMQMGKRFSVRYMYIGEILSCIELDENKKHY